MATVKELTAENKSLKQEIRDLRGLVKEGNEKAETLPSIAYGVVVQDSQFNLIKLKFDFEKKKALIDEVVGTYNDVGKFALEARNSIVDEIVVLSKGNK